MVKHCASERFSRQTEMRCLYKVMQRSSKAYDERIFSLTGLKQIIESRGFYFHSSYTGDAIIQGGFRLLWGSLKRFLRAKPPCSVHAGFVHAASLAEVFPSLLTGRKLGGAGFPRGWIAMDEAARPHLGGQRVPGGPAVSNQTSYSCYLGVGVEEMLH